MPEVSNADAAEEKRQRKTSGQEPSVTGMADVAVGSIGHQIPVSVVGRKMANEVTIDPKKPDHRAGEQKQACGLQRA